MQHWRDALLNLIASHHGPRCRKPQGHRRLELCCHELEERVTPSLGLWPSAAAAHVQPFTNPTGTTTPLTTPTSATNNPTGSSSSTGTSDWTHGARTSSSNPALKTALQALKTEIQTIEKASSVTVAELATIRSDFHTLYTDGLKLSSYSALRSFEDSLVTTNATTPGSLPNNSTLLSQFEALYTSSASSLTSQQTKDLTTAYNDLTTAVASANITPADITAVNTDLSAVFKALNNTSTPQPTFPYITLVTGHEYGPGLGLGSRGAR